MEPEACGRFPCAQQLKWSSLCQDSWIVAGHVHCQQSSLVPDKVVTIRGLDQKVYP